jgi:isopenicillin-N epimerase
MVAVQLPPCDSVSLHDRLRREHDVEIPVMNWAGRQMIRVSVQGYVTRADLETLLEVLPRQLEATRTQA